MHTEQSLMIVWDDMYVGLGSEEEEEEEKGGDMRKGRERKEEWVVRRETYIDGVEPTNIIMAVWNNISNDSTLSSTIKHLEGEEGQK